MIFVRFNPDNDNQNQIQQSPNIFVRLNPDEEGEVHNQAGTRVHPELQNPSSCLQEDEC